MINLTTTSFFDIILALFIAISFPVSLYIHIPSFWRNVPRDDVRIVIRNSLSVLGVCILSFVIVFLFINTNPIASITSTTTTTAAATSLPSASNINTQQTTSMQQLFNRIALFGQYTGLNMLTYLFSTNNDTETTIGTSPPSIYFNIFLEFKAIVFGIIIVNSLFLGSLVDNILAFVIPRNRQRVSHYKRDFIRQEEEAANKKNSNNNSNNLNNAGNGSNNNNQTHQSTNTSQVNTIQSTNDTDLPLLTQTIPFPHLPVNNIIVVSLYELINFTDDVSFFGIRRGTVWFYFKRTFSQYLDDLFKAFLYFLKSFDYTNISDCGRPIELDNVTTIRTIVVVPHAEEIVYRSALYPFIYHYLYKNYSEYQHNLFYTIVYSALLFASAHLHHFFRHYNNNGFAKALITVIVQWIYCFLFAMFCGYIYSLPLLLTPSTDTTTSLLSYNTSPLFSLPAAIICHTICNLYGLPSFDFFKEGNQYRFQILFSYIVGVVMFGTLLYILPAS